MKEIEKAKAGYLYDANNDEEIIKKRLICADLCYEYNNCRPSDLDKQKEIMRKILGKNGHIEGDFLITQPFHCDYGNISIGNNFYTNYNCSILDGAKVTFGDNVFIAPNCVFSTSGHALDAVQRAEGLEIAWPITIGNDVWIGANVSVLPGVTIGDGTVIGAGSVVNKDIPSGVVAAGNPCKVIRKITEDDKHKYKMYVEH